MILTSVLAFSALILTGAWLSLLKFQSEVSRKGVTGCEVARNILDLQGFSQSTIHESTPGLLLMPGVHQVLLRGPIFSGKRLMDLAEAAFQAVGMTQPPDVTGKLSEMASVLAGPAWILALFEGLFFPGIRFSLALAGILAVFILDLPRQYRFARQAYQFLKQTGDFEIDELIKLRGILRIYSWRTAAKAVTFSWAFFRNTEKKDKGHA